MKALGSNNSSSCPIPAHKWVAHFSGIFKSSVPEVSLDNLVLPTDLPQWLPVEVDKVSELIKTLKSHKAPGPYGIPAELFVQNFE